jgi:hypothetical protein
MEAQVKICQNCQKEFVIEPDDFGFYEKIKVPPPTFCPDCRLQRRLMFRNERTFYKRKCDLCAEDIIASYPADAPFPVYCIKCWWSDKWDPTSYGQDFDFSRPFFEQFKELFYRVPVIALMNDDGIASINCQYNYDFAFNKNCYLCACGWYNENVLYSANANHNKDTVDCYTTHNSELCYECALCEKCYGCSHCVRCSDSVNCIFGFDLRGCSNCVMCIGLRSKQYCILNEQHSKEEYEQKIKEMKLEDRNNLQKYKKQFQEFSLRFPRKYAQFVNCVKSTGDMLVNCKMSKNCFYFNDLENCRYMVMNDGAKDCHDCNNTGHPALCYEAVTPDNSYGCIATIFCWKCNKAEYSNNCHSSNNLFGCSALRTSEYAILNKKYSKQEYLALREKIIAHMRERGEWGEFFPGTLSPFAYNETSAYDWFRLNKEEALMKKYKWKDEEERNYQISLVADKVPAEIAKVQDSIIDEVLGCEHQGKCEEKCTTAFKITLRELQFYQRTNTPLPTLCPNCRFYQRSENVNLPHLWKRKCGCAGAESENNLYKNTKEHFHGAAECREEFETSYAPDKPEIVYCEKCYQAEVY